MSEIQATRKADIFPSGFDGLAVKVHAGFLKFSKIDALESMCCPSRPEEIHIKACTSVTRCMGDGCMRFNTWKSLKVNAEAYNFGLQRWTLGMLLKVMTFENYIKRG